MFDSLSQRLVGSIRKLRGQGHITEKNIEDTLKEIRLALIEADINFKVVKSLLERVKTKVLGQEVSRGSSAGRDFAQIVFDELKATLGGEAVFLDLRRRPSVIFLVGLQGSGKTTSAAKLALHIRQKFNKKPGLVSVDVYRPAAMDQLATLARQSNFSYLETTPQEVPEAILERAKQWAEREQLDVLIVDTAGRLQIEEELMLELARLKAMCPPQEVLLVADAMLGQQSVNVAEGFHQRVGLTGLILTKIDGDARGGAALSVREVIGVPIKFLGVGEKVSALEVFHPDRLASRLLDLGDLQSLAEKASQVIDQAEARESIKKIVSNRFTVDDFLKQMQMMKSMGGMESLLKMIPGMGQLTQQMKSMAPPEAEMKKIEAIIRSMTRAEREDLRLLNGSRRARIARGSGTEVKDINRFVQQFEQSQKMMSRLMKMGPQGLAGLGLGGGKGPAGRRFPFG
jgi:signal recognition particle subunit SRP54